MLERALREVLALGDLLQLDAALDQRAGDAAQSELDGERDADRAAAHDDDLIALAQLNPLAAAFWENLRAHSSINSPAVAIPTISS